MSQCAEASTPGRSRTTEICLDCSEHSTPDDGQHRALLCASSIVPGRCQLAIFGMPRNARVREASPSATRRPVGDSRTTPPLLGSSEDPVCARKRHANRLWVRTRASGHSCDSGCRSMHHPCRAPMLRPATGRSGRRRGCDPRIRWRPSTRGHSVNRCRPPVPGWFVMHHPA